MWQENIKEDIAPVVKQGIRRIRINQESRVLYKDLDIAADMKKKRLRWIGHPIRLDHGKVIKKIFESKPEERREIQDLD
jgi:hypothetical protein